MTSTFTDAQIADVKARSSLEDVAKDFGAQLRRSGSKLIGSCPLCGGKAKSNRFKIEGGGWYCFHCVEGGDVIGLVQACTGRTFAQAVEFLGGGRTLSAADEQRLTAQRLEREAQDRADAERYRQKEINRALAIWRQGHVVADQGLVLRYLAGRGCGLPQSAVIREVDDLDYYHGEEVDRNGVKSPRRVHHGPAMLAAFFNPEGQQVGVHITYLMREGDRVSKLKLRDPDAEGDWLVAKKMRGQKRGCHIVLRHPRVMTRLFLSEGIETGLSVARVLHRLGKLLPGDGFWAAGDLGNLAGPHAASVLHSTKLNEKTGRPLSVPGPEPKDDLGHVIVIPDSVTTLVLLGDGDSDRETMLHALTRVERRYTTPQRRVAKAIAGDGTDFNDMLMAALAQTHQKAAA